MPGTVLNALYLFHFHNDILLSYFYSHLRKKKQRNIEDKIYTKTNTANKSSPGFNSILSLRNLEQ